MAEPKTTKPATGKGAGKPRRKKKAAAEPRSRGIAPDAIGSGSPPAAITRLTEAIEADDCTEVAHLAHRLAGSSDSLGFRALANVLRTLEEAAMANDERRFVCGDQCGRGNLFRGGY